MVLERLSATLQDSVKKLLRLSIVDEKAVKELVRDLQRALLQSDVNVELVFEISRRIEDRALQEELPPGISRKEHVVKVLYDELTRFLGEKPSRIPVEAGKTNVLMLVGIQGSGKTTSAVKIARFLKKRGIKSALVCADTYRPGALAQLKQLAAAAGIPVYGEEDGRDPVSIALRGVENFRREGYEAILVDTAGRHKDEKSLIEEMKSIAEAVKPDQIMLVIDGTIGQQARVQAQAFHEATKVGSIMVVKLDGSARGGGALSAVAATGAPIVFLGTGEKTEDIELFEPARFVGRLLGMGDIRGLLEKVKEAQIAIPDEKAKAFLSGKFTLTEIYGQIESLRKLGPLGKLLKMLPGLGLEITDSMAELSEEKMKAWKAAIQSMTPEERENPRILSASRIRRVARGSGRSEKEVKELVQQFELMRKMAKTLRRRYGPLKMFQKRMFRNLQS
ncbi:signal recognition particle protein Srp54 [Candidatus Hecatella orcuttiae]|jgi:signal recognition particle subunit SRP54|uniref:signal recognition particle protein Srp54 n=1 Tax=Candidatus Hecatella orcuttiae TaxID=1935119 RepID=UPI002868383D|nr:signal recognition particle protein Srp54 [Candidatus Hecatella orcuttiae]